MFVPDGQDISLAQLLFKIVTGVEVVGHLYMIVAFDSKFVYPITGVERCCQDLRVLEVSRYNHNAALDFLWSTIPEIKLVDTVVTDNEWLWKTVPGQSAAKRPVVYH